MVMKKERSVKELYDSINNLIAEAETCIDIDTSQKKLSDVALNESLEGLDVLVSQEASLALQAEISRFSNVFQTEETQEMIHKAVTDVTRPLIESWINMHLPKIAREVVSEAIGRIAKSHLL